MTSEWEGSRPSHLMIVTKTKRHPNNTKTDQFLIFWVTTGLLPYHNSGNTDVMAAVCCPLKPQIPNGFAQL